MALRLLLCVVSLATYAWASDPCVTDASIAGSGTQADDCRQVQDGDLTAAELDALLQKTRGWCRKDHQSRSTAMAGLGSFCYHGLFRLGGAAALDLNTYAPACADSLTKNGTLFGDKPIESDESNGWSGMSWGGDSVSAACKAQAWPLLGGCPTIEATKKVCCSDPLFLSTADGTTAMGVDPACHDLFTKHLDTSIWRPSIGGAYLGVDREISKWLRRRPSDAAHEAYSAGTLAHNGGNASGLEAMTASTFPTALAAALKTNDFDGCAAVCCAVGEYRAQDGGACTKVDASAFVELEEEASAEGPASAAPGGSVFPAVMASIVAALVGMRLA